MNADLVGNKRTERDIDDMPIGPIARGGAPSQGPPPGGAPPPYFNNGPMPPHEGFRPRMFGPRGAHAMGRMMGPRAGGMGGPGPPFRPGMHPGMVPMGMGMGMGGDMLGGPGWRGAYPGYPPGMEDEGLLEAYNIGMRRGGRLMRRSQASDLGAQQEAGGNDYNQYFIDTGERPQNFLWDNNLQDKYEGYPEAKKLIELKDHLVAAHAHPPLCLQADLRTLPLTPATFGTKFDVAIVDPPWDEYAARAPGVKREVWNWRDIMALDIGSLMDSTAFVFLWCGSAEGLEAGRHCLPAWGFRRVEDIVWAKTNLERSSKADAAIGKTAGSILARTKEHCLVGMRGQVKRSLDGHFIHANVDTDVIVTEEPPVGSTRKPEELYGLVERFCLGTRRVELFGEDHNLRPGWVTVGRDITTPNFDPAAYAHLFTWPDGRPFVEVAGAKPTKGQPNLLPMTDQIERLRPKSPPPR